MRYYSQLGQDAVVERILGDKMNGTFVDVGEVYDRGLHIDDVYAHNSIYDPSMKLT